MAFIALHFNERLCALPASKEIVVGLLHGIPALGILRRVRFSKWDEFAGNLSYGVFVSHFVFIFLFQSYTSGGRYGVGMTTAIIAISTICAFLSYQLVELPVIKLRHQLRSGRMPPPSAPIIEVAA